jgi:MEMO1 family protein
MSRKSWTMIGLGTAAAVAGIGCVAFAYYMAGGLTATDAEAQTTVQKDAGNNPEMIIDVELIEKRRAAEVRPAACAGRDYPKDPEKLRKMLDALLAAEGGPGEQPAAGEPVRGLVAPHIDFRRGGPCYAKAYLALSRAAPADIYVILGTAHEPMPHLYGATRMDFQTPLGTVETDADFMKALADKSPFDLYAGEPAHRAEHSIEFQVIMLQRIFPDRRFRIAPVLCGSMYELIDDQQSPSEHPEVKGFIAALQAAIEGSGKRVCVIAGADLSHQGRHFHQDVDITDEFKRDLEARDRRMLDRLVSGGAEAFFKFVAEDGNRTDVCSVNNIYTMSAALKPKTVTLIGYGQYHMRREQNLVTFCSMMMR